MTTKNSSDQIEKIEFFVEELFGERPTIELSESGVINVGLSHRTVEAIWDDDEMAHNWVTVGSLAEDIKLVCADHPNCYLETMAKPQQPTET